MSYKTSNPVVFAVIFRHRSKSFFTIEEHAGVKLMGLKYAIAKRMSDQTTVRIKLVPEHGRPMIMDFTHTATEPNALFESIRRAIAAAFKMRRIAPSSVKEALA